MTFNCIRTNLPDYLKREEPLPDRKKFRPHLPSPLTLAELCGAVLDRLPFPPVWEWTVNDVANWIDRSLGFPHYKQTFKTNLINGRKLLLIDASALPRINITIFEDIKKITAGIRSLFKIELERYHRSISLPPRYPETMYLLYRQPTGPKRAQMTRLEFFRMMKMASDHKPAPCHWDMDTFKSDIPGKIIVGLAFKKKPWFPLGAILGMPPVPKPKPPKVEKPKKYTYPLRPALYVLHTVESK